MYYLQGSARTYYATQAGTVNYSTGVVSTNAYKFTSVSDVDGATSTKVRMTVIPNSNDVVPVRNQLLEIDLVNSTFNSSIDATATTGVGYMRLNWWFFTDNHYFSFNDSIISQHLQRQRVHIRE